MISEPPEVDTSEDRPASQPKAGQPQEARDRQPQDRQPRDRQPEERQKEEPKTKGAPEESHTGGTGDSRDSGGTGGKRRWWLWVLALLALAAAVYLLVHHNSKAKAAESGASADGSGGAGSAGGQGGKGGKGGAVPVLTATAQAKDMGVYLSGLGTVVSLNTVSVKSRVDGQLLRINFREGQLVRAGDVLAELDPRPFQVQLMQAQGQKSKDVAALQNAKVDLARYQTLIQSDSIPRQQLDTQAAMVAQIQASIESDQAAIESAKLNLTYARITAPTGGRIGLRQMDLGNIVHAADPTGLVTITQLQPIDVVFTLPADQLPQVVPQVHGGKVLPVDAYDRDLKVKLGAGQLLAVDNEIDPTTGTVKLKALFPNTDEALFPNQFVNARLLVNTLKNTVTVPSAAVQRSPQATFVYVVKPDKTVEVRNVAVQLTEGDDTSIGKGLAAGEQVVTDGIDKLRPGAKVQPTSPNGVANTADPGAKGAKGTTKGGRKAKAS
jgi:multidrug efflux system membrane fusion protein